MESLQKEMEREGEIIENIVLFRVMKRLHC